MGVEPAPLSGTGDAGNPGARHPRGPLPKQLLLSTSLKNPHRKSMARGSGPPRSDEPRGVSGPRTRVLQEDGKLRCPAGASLWLSEVRQENAFTQRAVYLAYQTDCQLCALREQCLAKGGQRGSSPSCECGPSSLASTRTYAC